MANTRKGFSRRTMTLLIMLLVAVIIGTLIAYEQISVLYVLCTLALVALLLVVGFSDLEGVGRTDTESET
jgi:Ca2+/Na+ antiporter